MSNKGALHGMFCCGNLLEIIKRAYRNISRAASIIISNKMLAHHVAIEYPDVTDNKPRDHLMALKDEALSESYMNMSTSMNDRLNYESERLKTFDNWPLSFMDKYLLARSGMYYTGLADTTKCHFCGVEIGHWEETDHPVSEHIKWSQHCPLMWRRQTNNIPINEAALDRLLPSVSYDVCGADEIRTTASNAAGIESESSAGAAASFANPDYPEYITEASRLRSFAEWPRTLKQKPADLAEAGFFYTHTGDRVMCFSCGGGLKDWDEDDDPWKEHALWFKNCNYLKLIKGQKYIDEIHGKQSTTVNNLQNDEEIQSGLVKDDHNERSASQISLDRTNALNSLENDEKKSSEDKSCKICYANDYNAVFLPCAHVVACVKCAASVTKCPLCREPISNITRLYFS